MDTKIYTEREARLSSVCVCGAPKEHGISRHHEAMVVCSACFGGEHGLKRSRLSFEDWQRKRLTPNP